MSREMKDSGLEWIGEIPEDWKLIRLCNMTKSIFLGKTPVYSEKENENYIVGQKNNQANGVDFSDIKYGEDEFYSQREEKEFLRYGDVLLNTLGGGSVGRIGYWNIKNNKKYITDGHLMVIRAKENCDSKFLYYAMVSQQKKLEDDAVGSTNQAFLTVTQVYKNVIASTDYEMQNKIAMWMWQGAIGVSKYYGVISPSYNTYRQKADTYDADYLEYLLRIPPLVATYAAYSTGITASRLRLYPQGFFSILFPVPPRKEQQEIAVYLNKKIPQIDRLIIKKEKFVDELKSYKRSLIYEYVTGKKEVPES